MRLGMAELASIYTEARDFAKGLKVGDTFRGAEGEADYRYEQHSPEHGVFAAVMLRYLPDFMLTDVNGRILSL